MAKRKIKLVDVESELLLRIGSEGTNTIPWEVLKDVGNKLEALLFSIAENSENPDSVPVRERFKLEFTGFYKGSSIPAFGFREQSQLSINDTSTIKKKVNTEFSFLMNEISRGDYRNLVSGFKTADAQHEIIKRVADFVNSPGDYGMAIVKRKSAKAKTFTPIYDLRQFKSQALIALKSPIKRADEGKGESVTAFAKLLLNKTASGRTKKKTVFVYKESESILVMQYKEIEHNRTRYVLNMPEFFTVSEEGKGVLLENEKLDLYAAGNSVHEAKEDLFYQFDATYRRFKELDDNVLSDRLLAVKKYYLLIVKSIEQI